MNIHKKLKEAHARLSEIDSNLQDINSYVAGKNAELLDLRDKLKQLQADVNFGMIRYAQVRYEKGYMNGYIDTLCEVLESQKKQRKKKKRK